jgi:hypothetical protein
MVTMWEAMAGCTITASQRIVLDRHASSYTEAISCVVVTGHSTTGGTRTVESRLSCDPPSSGTSGQL